MPRGGALDRDEIPPGTLYLLKRDSMLGIRVEISAKD